MRSSLGFCKWSKGSGKGSVVGEFCVDIEATKACPLSFPFKNSASNTQFHVLIQRIQENGNQRELEEIEGLKSNQVDHALRRYFSNGDVEEGVKASAEDEPLRKTASLQPTLHGTRRGLNGSDVTLSSTDRSSGLNTPRKIAVQNNNNINKDEDQQRTQWELAIVPVNDSSSVYSLNSPKDVFFSEPS